MIGQAIGGNTEATLIGAAVGTGIGYIIGNEKDKKHAQELQAQSPAAAPAYAHNETAPLGGTTWQVVSVNPAPDRPFRSAVVEFQPHGQVVLTRTNLDGKVEVVRERYRVVGNTLIVNRPGYLINAKYSLDGPNLILDTPGKNAVLRRVGN